MSFSAKPLIRDFFRYASFVFLCLHALPCIAQDDLKLKSVKQQQAEMLEKQFFMSQLMQLRYSEELRDELEVVESQVQEVMQLAENYQKDMMKFHAENQAFYTEIQQLNKEGRTDEVMELSKEIQLRQKEFSESYLNKAKETLLPHQVKRLQQISKQQRVKRMNQFQDEFGVAASMADELGLSEEERNRLVDAIKKARKDYYAEVASAKKKANAKIMSALTAQQQQQMKDILGDPYDQEVVRRRDREKMMQKQRESYTKRRSNEQKN